MHSKTLVSRVSRRGALRHAPLALALAAALGLAPLAASAATITVTSGGDTGSTSTCTLRQAIVSMNIAAVTDTTCVNSGAAFGSADTITFDTSVFPTDGSGTIILGGGRLAVAAADLILDASANNNVTIDANQASGVLIDSAVSGSSLTLKHLTLTHGKVTADDCHGQPVGGGICSPDADLVLQNSTVIGNSATGGGGVYSRYGSITLTNSTVSGNLGGGVYDAYSSITLNNSTVSGNSLFGWGGGIGTGFGSVTLTNSTVSDNSSYYYGGGIYFDTGSVTLTNSTVSGNLASRAGGGVYSRDASITLTNSTVSGNSATTSGNGIFTYTGATITAWNSIVSGNIGGGNDIDGVTPSGDRNLIGNVSNLNLLPLADNGGPTQTMLPQADSAAINAGDTAHCPAIDQRGIARPQDGVCDIGAVEVAPVSQITALGGSGQSVPVWQNFFNPLSIQVSGPGLHVAPGTPLYVTAPTGAHQPSATCTDGVSNAAGLAYFYCRANGVAGSYVVEVHAAGWPSVAPAVFVLTNSADPEHIFMDGFDPPGPRSALPFAEAGADFGISP